MTQHTHVLTPEELHCLQNCSDYKQYYVMRERFENDRCTFCHLDANLNVELFGNAHWYLTANAFKGDRACEVMLLIVTRDHYRFLHEIPVEGWSALHEIIAWAKEHYPPKGGMAFIRYGDMRRNAGTVPHLHINLWEPDETADLRIPIFKHQDSGTQEKNKLRAEGFAAAYEAGKVPE